MEPFLAYGGWIAAMGIGLAWLVTAWFRLKAEDKLELEHAREVAALRSELAFRRDQARFDGLQKALTMVWKQ